MFIIDRIESVCTIYDLSEVKMKNSFEYIRSGLRSITMVSKKINPDTPVKSHFFMLLPGGLGPHAFPISSYRLLRVTMCNYCVFEIPFPNSYAFSSLSYILTCEARVENTARANEAHMIPRKGVWARKSRSRVTISYGFDILKLEEA